MSYIDNEKDVKNLEEGEFVETLPHVGAAGGVGAAGRRVSVIPENFGDYIHDAVDAVEHQKNQSVGDALKMYKWGVIYSLCFSA